MRRLSQRWKGAVAGQPKGGGVRSAWLKPDLANQNEALIFCCCERSRMRTRDLSNRETFLILCRPLSILLDASTCDFQTLSQTEYTMSVNDT